MKRSTVFAGLSFCFLLIVCIILLAINKPDIGTNNDTQQELSHVSNNADASDRYYENGVDENYNYIINLKQLTQYNLPLVGTEQIGDEVDYLLKENGIYGKELSILSSSKSKGIVNLIIGVDTGQTVYVQYDYTKNELVTYMKD